MKILRKPLALALVLMLALGMALSVSAAEGESGFGGMPAGTYTYVSGDPTAEAGTDEGQVKLDYLTDTIVWAFGGQSGSAVLSGDALKFFQGLYLSDLPVTDWFGGDPKDTEGYAGAVSGYAKFTLDGAGRISAIDVSANPATRATAVLSKDITAETLTIIGITRGQPNLLQSCITLVGSVNGLYLTKQGDVILNHLTIGSGADGVGLKADKIGGDTFIVGRVFVDGSVEWHNLMGVILPLGSESGILETNGQSISLTGGSNVGRVGRNLSIISNGGDITIGAEVTTDSTRGGLLPNANTSNDGVTVNTSGRIIAGAGNVTIGTNTEKAVIIDLIGEIQGNNVTIKPNNRGTVANITGAIGNINATGNIDIEVGAVNVNTGDANVNDTNGFTSWVSAGNDGSNVIGSLTSENGSIKLKAGAVNGGIGALSAPKGTVTLEVESADSVSARRAPLSVNGQAVSLDGYLINGNYFFTLDSLAGVLSGVDLTGVAVPAISIGGSNYCKLRDVGAAAGFGVDWDAAAGTVIITTGIG